MTGLFLAGMAVLYWAASSYATIAADRSFDRLLAGSALSIAESLTVTADGVRVDIPYSALDMLAAAPDDRVFYRVVAPTGVTVTGYSDLPSFDAVVRGPGNQGINSEEYFDADYRGESVRFVVLGRESGNLAQKGWTWVQLGQTRNARTALSRELLIQALVPIGLMTIMALVVLWFSIGRALRPLDSLRATLVAKDPSDLSPIGTSVPDEVAPLVEGMNNFMARLEGNINFLQDFIANTAHQLRTPLSALIVQLQLVDRGSENDRKHGLMVANRSAKKLSRLIDQLLGDALIGHRSHLGKIEHFDLKKMIARAVRDTASMMEDHNIRFSCALPDAPYSGDQLVIEEAVKNVIHNALTHGHREGHAVEIHLTRDGPGYAISVMDRGSGISPELLGTVFDRFKRGNGSAGGSGLGLAIVRQAIEQQSGQVTIANRSGGGTIVTLALPLERARS
jgi:two-component system sensor histidine kinase TctE